MVRVLVVDDEAGYRASLSFFLIQAGNSVVAVATADDARREADILCPDVLVADWLIGGRVTGADLARQLRSQLPDLQVILITGLDACMVRPQLEDLKIFELLEKPFEPGHLVEAVREAGLARNAPPHSLGS